MKEAVNDDRFALTIMDEASRFVQVHCIRKKYEGKDVFKRFKTQAESQTGARLLRLRTDGGTEFWNKEMIQLADDSGFIHESTPPYVHERNGLIERVNRTLVTKARALLTSASLPNSLWPYALHHSTTFCLILPYNTLLPLRSTRCLDQLEG